ncbi:GNAT family N-acetyltransferase [Agrobacterium pusense]|uniref:GNAT family N-acetyltransferase n=1 Tax=Agrobacterium pusense TaxID=648995 RepID=UPI0008915C01|nr:GNAT family N-acetyltransferase [Agrobacterium pusense]OOO22692.1 GCN5 family acetyltransferase [Agrobacterium pusense]WKD45045.1 GNAT family N-acetyltransferase [Agrobacterium pusense]SDE62275.1 N-acetylglutamate synthase, GNAT family [Agrobacterium pusense]
MDIRFAKRKDRDRIVALLRESHEAAGFTFPFQASYADRLFQQHLASDKACVLVAGERPQGVLMACAFEHPFGAGRIAKETVWYVTPSARGRGAIKMLDAYEAWARSVGCVSAGMASLATNDVSSLYERCGYSAVETHFMKPL